MTAMSTRSLAKSKYLPVSILQSLTSIGIGLGCSHARVIATCAAALSAVLVLLVCAIQGYSGLDEQFGTTNSSLTVYQVTKRDNATVPLDGQDGNTPDVKIFGMSKRRSSSLSRSQGWLMKLSYRLKAEFLTILVILGLIVILVIIIILVKTCQSCFRGFSFSLALIVSFTVTKSPMLRCRRQSNLLSLAFHCKYGSFS